MSVPNDVVRDAHRHNVRQPLYLMDHGVGEGHLDPVVHAGDPVRSNHPMDLFVDLG